MLERDYQMYLIKEIREMLYGAFVLKNDSSYLQGIPDLLILYYDRWAVLEVKRKRPTRPSDWEPNQEWYLEQLGYWSYAACIYPENEEVILYELRQALAPDWSTRVFEP